MTFLHALLGVFISVVYAIESIISPIPISGSPQPAASLAHRAVRIFSLSDRGGRSPEALATNTEETGREDGVVLAVFASNHETAAVEATTADVALTPRVAKSDEITIAVLGDSMVDTLGPDMPELGASLESLYSDTEFTFLNFGVGGTNAEFAVDRITDGYTYLDIEKPSIVSQKPDLVVIESFAYNPFPQASGGLERHWLALSEIVDTIRAYLPDTQILFAVTVAPNANVFGDGAPGIAFPPEEKQRKVDEIKSYLESTIKFAASEGLPLADAYTPSLMPDGNGNAAYINAGDHIHTSPAGRQLFADVVAESIAKHGLIE